MAISQSIADRFWFKVDIRNHDECWLWKASVRGVNGYGQFVTRKPRVFMAHRFSWMLTRGPIPDGLYVLHRCDVKRCVNPFHLFLGTQADNIHDAVQKGLMAHGTNHWTHRRPDKIRKGERHSQAKLTEQQVRSIYADPRSIRHIAETYKMHWLSIYRIKKRIRWQHLVLGHD